LILDALLHTLVVQVEITDVWPQGVFEVAKPGIRFRSIWFSIVAIDLIQRYQVG